jgi:hypothetical protein
MRIGIAALTVFLSGCAEIHSTMQQLGIETQQRGAVANSMQQRNTIPKPGGQSITGDNIVFYHQAYSAKAYRSEDLLMEGSAAGSKRDEFERQAVFRQEVPVMQARVEHAKQNPSVYLMSDTELGEYDFNTKAFPTRLTKDTRYMFRASGYFADAEIYGVSVANPEAFQWIPVPEDKARPVVIKLREARDRKAVAVLVGKVVGTVSGSDPTHPETKRCLKAYEYRRRSAGLNSDRVDSFGGPSISGCTEIIQPRLVRLRVDRIDYYLPDGQSIGTSR